MNVLCSGFNRNLKWCFFLPGNRLQITQVNLKHFTTVTTGAFIVPTPLHTWQISFGWMIIPFPVPWHVACQLCHFVLEQWKKALTWSAHRLRPQDIPRAFKIFRTNSWPFPQSYLERNPIGKVELKSYLPFSHRYLLGKPELQTAESLVRIVASFSKATTSYNIHGEFSTVPSTKEQRKNWM